jgi:hypothetical protein
MQRLHEVDHIASNIHFVIPGAEASAGASIIGLRPMISARVTTI